MGWSPQSIMKRMAERHRWLGAALGSVEAFRRHRMALPSAHFAFNAFLGIFPLLLFASAVIGYILSSRPDLEARAFQLVYDMMPELGDRFRSMIDGIIANRTAVGLVGLGGLLWSATRILGSLETGLSFVWGGAKRSFFKKRFRGIAILSLFFALAIAAVGMNLVSSHITSWASGRLGPIRSFLSVAAGNALGLALSFGFFMVTYRFVPAKQYPWAELARGSLVSAVLYFTLFKLFNFYLTTISNTQLLFGSIGIVIGMMIWLNLVGVVIFFGAEMIAQLSTRKVAGVEPDQGAEASGAIAD